MRAACVIVVALLALPFVAATPDPTVVYMDADSYVLAPTLGVRELMGIEQVTSADLSLATDACHTELRGSLSWQPTEYGAAVGPRSVAIETELRARLLNATDSLVHEWTYTAGFGSFVQRVDANATYHIQLAVDVGADIHTHVKILGWVQPGAPGCG